MADKAIGVHLKDWHTVQGVRTGNSPWSPIAIAQVPVKEPAPSAPTIESVTAPEASAGVLEIKVSLPETNDDGTALARAELVRLRLHHSTSSGVTESDPHVDFPPSETLLWAPNDTATHYVRVRVQDSHGLWSELSNEASGQAHASTPQEDSGLWAHRLGVESIFTNDSPDPGYVSWSNVVLYWKDNKYEIADGSTNKKYIWWDYSTSTTTFQTSDTRPELDLEDVIVGYNDNGTWRLMCYQPTVMADYVRAGVLQSSNWSATTGSQLDLDNGTLKLGGSDSPKFQVDADGVLHATGAVISGALTAGEGSSIDGVYIEDATITSAKISDLTFDKITAGTNTASLTIGSGGYIKSANYSAGSAGFKIDGSGDAEFNDVTVRGTLITTNPDSEINADYIKSGTITGRTIQTSSDYPKAIMAPTVGGYSHALAIYNSSGDVETAIWEGQIGLWNNSGTQTFQLYGDDGTGTAKMEFRTSGGQIYFWNGGKIYGTSSDPVELQHTFGRFTYCGETVFNDSCPSTWTDLDLSSYVGSRRALVFLRVKNAASTAKKYRFRPNGDTRDYSYGYDRSHCSACTIDPDEYGTVWVMTDTSGIIEWMSEVSESTILVLLAYIT